MIHIFNSTPYILYRGSNELLNNVLSVIRWSVSLSIAILCDPCLYGMRLICRHPIHPLSSMSADDPY